MRTTSRTLTAAALAALCSAAAPGALSATVVLPGGAATVYATGRLAFSFPAANLDQNERTRFAIGNSFFRRNWVEAPSSTAARDGLGPFFIARSCGGCHEQGGRGAPPRTRRGRNVEQPVALLLRLSIPGENEHGGPKPEPVYGERLATSAIRGVPVAGRIDVRYREKCARFADKDRYCLRAPRYRIVDAGYGPLDPRTMVSPRIAQQLIGQGLLEAIPETDILQYAQEQAARDDGIRGTPNRVWDAVGQRMVLGRFGWKANVGSVAHQVAAAFASDMGITSGFFPSEGCTPTQKQCLAAPTGSRAHGPEIDDRTLADVIFFQTVLAPPAQRILSPVERAEGEALFRAADCAVCHRPTWTTAMPADATFATAALSGQDIAPYTDLLLHDMGEALADGRPDYLASGRQWRTPPLWGVGLIRDVNDHDFLLHDGRARGVLEAILWHGGEAQRAKERVLGMTRAQRRALVRFVESL